MYDMRSLKALQLDALREVANIGAGHAATALSQMINSPIMISVPTINVTRLEEVPPQISAPATTITFLEDEPRPAHERRTRCRTARRCTRCRPTTQGAR